MVKRGNEISALLTTWPRGRPNLICYTSSRKKAHVGYITYMMLMLIIVMLSRLMGKQTICIGENKGADQLRGNREADQRLCFHYSDNTIPPQL